MSMKILELFSTHMLKNVAFFHKKTSTVISMYLINILQDRRKKATLDGNRHRYVDTTVVTEALSISAAGIHNWVLSECHGYGFR
jgi:hypothetical protein